MRSDEIIKRKQKSLETLYYKHFKAFNLDCGLILCTKGVDLTYTFYCGLIQ